VLRIPAIEQRDERACVNEYAAHANVLEGVR